MNILSMVIDRDGCSGYRVKNPLKAIEQSGDEHQVHFIEKGDTGMQIVDLVMGANVIIFRQSHDKMFHFFKKQKEIDFSKKLLVVDMDDDIFNITPFADTYKWGGVEEAKYNGKWLWKNGDNDFDTERNKDNLKSCVKMMAEADLITVTTEHLKKRMTEISGNTKVEILPNAIDFRHWQKWPFVKTNQIRVGWTGGSTHYIDWYTIIEPLKKVFNSDKNLKLILQGCKWDGTIKGIDYEYHDWIDFDAHPYKSASLNLDFAIIPLKDTLFNHSKSCIKWYEFSSLGIPCLISKVPPYSLEAKHNETAILYSNNEEFIEGFNRLKNDKELRERIGKNAREWVKKNRNLANISKQYIDIYKKYSKI
jgi:glycosyltransferase involved in cell wall biosynthesis